MIDDLANYFLRLSRSQVMSDLKARRYNYDTMLILRGVVAASRPYVATHRIICTPPYGVLWFKFHIKVDQGDC